MGCNCLAITPFLTPGACPCLWIAQADEAAQLEDWRQSENQRLQRERRVLEKQSRALLKLPSKKERSAVEAAEAALEAERREARAREARHKLTVERLRRQIVELQVRAWQWAVDVEEE